MSDKNGAALAKTTNVAPLLRPAERAFEPTSMEEAYRLAKILVASRMLPRHLGTPEAAFAVIAAGRELGLTALQSTRSIYFIEGKVTLSADLMVALVKRHPECEYFTVTEATNEKVTCTTKRTGEEPTTMTWTIADAQRAKLTGKANWQAYPKAMLRARVAADLCRAVYPDAFMGIYDPDELQREPAQKVPAPTIVVSEPEPVQEEPAPELPEAKHDAVDDPSPEDIMGDVALVFNQKINDATTTAELIDIKAEVKRAGLSEVYTVPLGEFFLRKKKELTAAEKMRQPGQD